MSLSKPEFVLDSIKDRISDAKNSVIKFITSLSASYRQAVTSGANGPGDGVIMSTAAEIRRLKNMELRNDIVTKLLGATIGVGLSLLTSYFIIRLAASILDPEAKQKKEAKVKVEKLMEKLGRQNSKIQLTEYELSIANSIVESEKLETDWSDIGGLEAPIQQIKQSVLIPFQYSELYEGNTLYKAPKGVLLYGPPGCGKTLVARAIAKCSGAAFINLEVASLFDKWYGESEKRTKAVFSLATKLEPSVLFIDEIDSLLRARTSFDHETTSLMKAQFMSLWDGLLNNSKARIIVIGATNRPLDIDDAIRRRMPVQIKLDYPTKDERSKILAVTLRNQPVQLDFYSHIEDIASLTEGYSGADLQELCRTAFVNRVSEVMHQELELNDSSKNNMEAHEQEAKLNEAAKKVAANSNSNSSKESLELRLDDVLKAYEIMQTNRLCTSNFSIGGNTASSFPYPRLK